MVVVECCHEKKFEDGPMRSMTNTHVGSDLDIGSMLDDIFFEFPNVENSNVIGDGTVDNGTQFCINE